MKVYICVLILVDSSVLRHLVCFLCLESSVRRDTVLDFSS